MGKPDLNNDQQVTITVKDASFNDVARVLTGGGITGADPSLTIERMREILEKGKIKPEERLPHSPRPRRQHGDPGIEGFTRR